jgi:hypothetical protein
MNEVDVLVMILTARCAHAQAPADVRSHLISMGKHVVSILVIRYRRI